MEEVEDNEKESDSGDKVQYVGTTGQENETNDEIEGGGVSISEKMKELKELMVTPCLKMKTYP